LKSRDRDQQHAFADFINPDGATIAATYRQRFQDVGRLPAPVVAVAAWVVCADSDE
jgi:hypothetical protein